MIRLLALTLSALTAIFFAMIAAVHTQPENTDLRAFLLPSADCTMPCWQGIRPGATTADQALAILSANPWVKDVNGAWTQSASGARTYTNITWSWSGQQPAFAFNPATLTPPYLHIRNGVVQFIRIATDISYGAVWSIMGAPATGSLPASYSNAANRRRTHSAGYFGGEVVFDTEIDCMVNPIAFWNAPVSITYSDGSIASYAMPSYDMIHFVYQEACGS